MGIYILKRLVMMIPVLFGITVISFVVINLAPGDPTSLMTDLNPRMNEEAIKRLRDHYHLDDPLYVRYWDWLKRASTLDFGRSFVSALAVAT